MVPTYEPLYIAARRVLLDALDALADHRAAVVLAGAQAIYLRTGSADLDRSVAPFTTDADLTIDPRVLGPDPDIKSAMLGAGFSLTHEPGIWTRSVVVPGRSEPVVVPVDLLVPEALAGKGRRSAHKLHDRFRDVSVGKAARLKPKDAGDVFRLMRTEPADELGRRSREIAQDEMAGPSVHEGVDRLLAMFGRRRSPGVDLAVQALRGVIPEAQVRALVTAYIGVLRESYAE